MLTLGKGRAGKGKCELRWDDLVAYGEGLIAVLLPDVADAECGLRLRRLREAFGDRAYMALTLRRRPNDQLRLHDLANLATQMGVATVELASVGNRTSVLPLPHGRGDQARHGSGPDPRERPPKGSRAQDFVDPYGHTDDLRVKSRNFH